MMVPRLIVLAGMNTCVKSAWKSMMACIAGSRVTDGVLFKCPGVCAVCRKHTRTAVTDRTAASQPCLVS